MTLRLLLALTPGLPLALTPGLPFGSHRCKPFALVMSPRLALQQYQPPNVQPILEPTTKLPSRKLQYPTYVKDTDPDAHIKVFKKVIKANGEVVEANVINLFGFTFRDNLYH